MRPQDTGSHNQPSVAGRPRSALGRRLRVLPRLVRLWWTVAPRTATLVTVLGVGVGLFPVAEVHVLRQLVEAAQQVVQGSMPLAMGLAWGGLLGGLALLHAAADNGQRFIHEQSEDLLRAAIEERCCAQVQAMHLEDLDVPAHYDQLLRLRRGVDQRLASTMQFLWGNLSNLVVLISLPLYLGQIHWALPVLLVLGTTPGVLAQQRFLHTRYLVERRQAPHERRFDVFNSLMTGRRAAAELRLFGFGTWLMQQAEYLWQRLQRERLQVATIEARATLFADGMNAVVYLAVIAFGVGLLVAGRLRVSAAAAFFAAVESFQQSYAAVASATAVVYSDLRYIQDFFDFVDAPRRNLHQGKTLAGPVKQGVVFGDVSFTYPGAERPVLSNLNLRIRPGERIALVGENGAGKTTLVKLLMGLYRPTAGCILVDGIDLCTLAPADWYRRIGAVFQDFLRYQTTVRENVQLGWVQGRDDPAAFAAAVARSGADEVAATLPANWDTPLGKEFHEGAELSVGQWQKLAIARAYLRPAELLILDEPASGLDAKAEAEVYEHFLSMAAARTVIFISHRLGSCRIADRVVFLHQGQVVEQGTHAELLATGGKYAEMYRLQVSWYQ